MKVRKHTIEIAVEVLDIESAPALLAEVADRIRNETVEGVLSKSDGDTASWSLTIENQKDI